MKRLIASAAIAASVMIAAPAAPAAAQRYNGWNANEFWRGAPSDPWQRIGFLRQRIERGRQDGSLTPAEARRAERELRQIERSTRRSARGGLSGTEAANLQARLDNLSRNLRWARHNSVGNDRDWSRFRTSYDARRYYRAGPQYRERRLTARDEIYRGSDGRYYCKRSDGTTGLVVGGAAGALLGNIADGGHNRLAGTLIGGALGALVGKTIDQNSDIRCR